MILKLNTSEYGMWFGESCHWCTQMHSKPKLAESFPVWHKLQRVVVQRKISTYTFNMFQAIKGIVLTIWGTHPLLMYYLQTMMDSKTPVHIIIQDYWHGSRAIYCCGQGQLSRKMHFATSNGSVAVNAIIRIYHTHCVCACVCVFNRLWAG